MTGVWTGQSVVSIKRGCAGKLCTTENTVSKQIKDIYLFRLACDKLWMRGCPS